MEKDPHFQFAALYQQNALAGPRISVSKCSHLFATSRLTGTLDSAQNTLDSAQKNGYQLLVELQQSTYMLLTQMFDQARQARPVLDMQALNRIVDGAGNTLRQRIADTRMTTAARLEGALHQVDMACNKYLARDSRTVENFLALHAAVNVCIAVFEAAAVRQPEQ